ncbi:ribonucleotide-diphosphate reductase subunit beta [Acinetobacter baumannii]|uniref:ribonucleotide-diphosphate reductase subunit beta n=1 Tax=Acinetobacter baumannii TaxID=470 RepID=UPI0018FF7BF6|nr:ribonucleotide-diphosphate reductase subunit beta [Acinetobacter baumannii]MBJ9380620.1 ribonucleotide-diphosphate reductase subunit beta [Acinetobacter baumannii]MBJ9576100.1 ribonucleotide-diphosphate reductase subunit beta [Acinetobacter baumannii]MBJ9736645.1 ribonucleotide-diphosphate reductase subunit beta [Acinetobacter baumannii]
MTYANRINDRRLILGPKDDLMAISPMKHTWARDIHQRMKDNNWFPEVVDLSNEGICYRDKLTEAERRLYDKSLAFLSNLDGIQFHNINQNIAKHVTSPEVAICLSRQAWEEANHVESYAKLIETVSADPMSVYMTFERDGILAKKNEFILRQSRILGDQFSARGFALACISNVMLEGEYFFSGFLGFYLLAFKGKMLGSADMIRYIQRDEEGTHLDLFLNMIETLRIENPEVFTFSFWEDAAKIIDESTKMEISWGQYIHQGVTNPEAIELYIKYLANKRAAQIRAPFVPYPGVVNPFPWVEEFSKPNTAEKNFFETRVTDYKTGGALAW